jgi:WD40 repeat protein
MPDVVTLPTSSNLLSTSVGILPFADAANAQPFILASTADRRLNVVQPNSQGFDIVNSLTQLQDSPILSFTIISQRYLACTSMSGQLVVFDCKKNEVIAKRKDHTKYVVQISSFEDKHGLTWLATAAWDKQVLIYRVDLSDANDFRLAEPAASIQLPTNPEALLFVRHPEDGTLNLLVTRRDSSFLFYYEISGEISGLSTTQPTPLTLSGEQNLAPYSNAWVAFTPAALALCPTDQTLLAVATSTIPHMKLLIVRLLFPTPKSVAAAAGVDLPQRPVAPTSLLGDANASTPAAREGRIALALQDREAAAIILHCNTMAPQTQYSSPALAWRPDGSGIFVSSDDGVLRGIEAITGKVVSTLVHHVPGSKIRCVWAGVVHVSGQPEEWILSGGFDHQLIVWRVRKLEA